MLVTLILNVIVLFIGALFSWLPAIEKIPDIAGYDIDTELVTGSGQLHLIFGSFWVLGVMFQGFLYLMGYYIVKNALRFFLGSRTPTD
jgi:hypothetical protein